MYRGIDLVNRSLNTCTCIFVLLDFDFDFTLLPFLYNVQTLKAGSLNNHRSIQVSTLAIGSKVFVGGTHHTPNGYQTITEVCQLSDKTLSCVSTNATLTGIEMMLAAVEAELSNC